MQNNAQLILIGYLSFTKDHSKLDLLLILVLALPLNFLNYKLPILLLSILMSYDTVRRCMKLQIKIGFGQYEILARCSVN